ncbi:MAG: hypothetical protein KDC54_23345, partial [Lewinella sp.]|nr:hypothetical protein [Lewinella sp.]
MKNISGMYAVIRTVSLWGLLLGVSQAGLAQFQTTIGFPYPASERSPGGIVLPNGDYAISAGNFAHPNGLFGAVSEDWQLLRLQPGGQTAGLSKMLGRPPAEQVAWMELGACNGQSQFVVAGSASGNMTLTFTNMAGDPGPIKEVGSTTNVETAACVKVDGNGDVVLLGTQLNVSGQQAVTVVKTDCNGTQLWNWVFYFTGWSAEAASITAFDTYLGSCLQPPSNKYFITGTMTPLAGGPGEVFLLSINASNGSFDFMNRYVLNPSASDQATCIQASCQGTVQPEIWISGSSTDLSTGAQTVLMLKTNVNGNPIWANNYDIGQPNEHEFATDFTFGPGGSLVVTGKAEEMVIAQGLKSGNAMLMRIAGSGNTVDWTRIYSNTDFSAQGNRVEP